MFEDRKEAGGTGAGHEVREVMGVGRSGRPPGKGAATVGVIGPQLPSGAGVAAAEWGQGGACLELWNPLADFEQRIHD